MKISDSLIRKFFQNRCTPEEAALVADYLQEHPELTEAYFSEKEWDAFVASAADAENTGDPTPDLPAMTVRRRQRLPHYKTWLAAASLALLCGLSVIYFQLFRKQPAASPAATAQVQPPRYLEYFNYDGQAVEFDLYDGSHVKLYGHSSLTVDLVKRTSQRYSRLEGKADFQVAKDASRPFTVEARQVQTTALGTHFLIDATHLQQVSVNLLEGRVVVTSIAPQLAENMDSVFMTAGQQLYIDKVHFTAKLHRTVQKSEIALVTKKPVKQAMPSADAQSLQIKGDHIAFNNQSLKDVFKVLEDKWGAAISFDESDLKAISFTGEFKIRHKPDGSVDGKALTDDIITTIAALNQLTVDRQGSQYLIHKK